MLQVGCIGECAAKLAIALALYKLLDGLKILALHALIYKHFKHAIVLLTFRLWTK